MIHRCNICGKRGKIGLSFRVAPIDAIGFVLLLLVSMVPVWLFSFIVAVVISSFKYDLGPIQELIIMLSTIVYFLLFGSKVANFISLFVDYTLRIRTSCKACDEVLYEKEFP